MPQLHMASHWVPEAGGGAGFRKGGSPQDGLAPPFDDAREDRVTERLAASVDFKAALPAAADIGGRVGMPAWAGKRKRPALDADLPVAADHELPVHERVSRVVVIHRFGFGGTGKAEIGIRGTSDRGWTDLYPHKRPLL